MTRDELDALIDQMALDNPPNWREHRYVGGPPPARLKRMQLLHETRARHHGVPWEMVDLRTVYARCDGRCGICGEAVPLEQVTFDHIIPLSRGGPHVASNLQAAHASCNSRKGDR